MVTEITTSGSHLLKRSCNTGVALPRAGIVIDGFRIAFKLNESRVVAIDAHLNYVHTGAGGWTGVIAVSCPLMYRFGATEAALNAASWVVYDQNAVTGANILSTTDHYLSESLVDAFQLGAGYHEFSIGGSSAVDSQTIDGLAAVLVEGGNGRNCLVVEIKPTGTLLNDLTDYTPPPPPPPAGGTVLLLHGNGTDGSTVITDSSASAHVVTANGGAQIDTAQSKFGSASILFDGSGDSLSIPAHADFNFGTGDFTIDAWVRRNGAQSSFSYLLSTASAGGWNLLFGAAGYGAQNAPYFSDNSNSTTIASTTPLPDLTWSHVALVRNGNTLTMYQDGVATGSASVTGKSFSYGSASVVRIGSSPTPSNFFNGWIDELRILKGTAAWTANFTPPASEYV